MMPGLKTQPNLNSFGAMVKNLALWFRGYGPAQFKNPFRNHLKPSHVEEKLKEGKNRNVEVPVGC